MIGRGGIVFCIGGGTQCYVENTPFLFDLDMIPDKLYLSPVIYGTITNLSPNPDCEGEVEYIRKNALLEWLEGKMTIEGATEGIVGGYDMALKDVIDKINSL